MSYSVGSLADLISGSAGSSRQEDAPLAGVFGTSGQKVRFQQVPQPKRVKKKAKSAPTTEGEEGAPEGIKESFPEQWAHDEDYVAPGRLTRPPRRPRDVPSHQERDPEQEARTLFVGNLPGKVQKKAVSRLFREFGVVEAVRFRCAAVPDPKTSKKVAVIKRTFHSERTSISAYVRLSTRAAAEEALKLNGTEFAGNHIRVDLADNPAKGENKKAVFVGNLPFGVEENDLWDFFQDCGKISWVRVIRDKSGIGMGCGFVNFEETKSVDAALGKDGMELRNRNVVVQRYAKKPRAKIAVVVEDTRKMKKQDGERQARRKMKKEDKINQGWREREGKKVVFRKEKKHKRKELGDQQVTEAFAGEETNAEGKRKKKKRMNTEERRKKKVAKLLAT